MRFIARFVEIGVRTYIYLEYMRIVDNNFFLLLEISSVPIRILCNIIVRVFVQFLIRQPNLKNYRPCRNEKKKLKPQTTVVHSFSRQKRYFEAQYKLKFAR